MVFGRDGGWRGIQQLRDVQKVNQIWDTSGVKEVGAKQYVQWEGATSRQCGKIFGTQQTSILDIPLGGSHDFFHENLMINNSWARLAKWSLWFLVWSEPSGVPPEQAKKGCDDFGSWIVIS